MPDFCKRSIIHGERILPYLDGPQTLFDASDDFGENCPVGWVRLRVKDEDLTDVTDGMAAH